MTDATKERATTAAAAASEQRVTPAMRQYFTFKKQHPDCVLFFRMGDFYEMFYEDAVLVHRVLGLTLTERSSGVPMAGVPYHSVDGYLRKMVQAGHRVAVCEQTQDPKEAKGVVERAVQRVLTPGTLSDESLLQDDASNNLGAICFLDAGDDDDGRVAMAVVEVSTGAFTLFETTAARAMDELARRGVNELLVAQTATGETPPRATRILEALGVSGTPRPSWQFRLEEAREAIQSQYRVATVGGFGLSDDDPALAAAGAVIRYLHETQAIDSDGEASRLAHLAPPMREDPRGSLLLDATSLRALEVEKTMRTGGAEGSLLGVFQGKDGCRTAMGRRLLRDWLLRPLANRDAIEARQRCVATLREDGQTATAIDNALGAMQDAARIAGRLGVGRATPRDVVALGGTLAKLDDLLDALEGAPALAERREALHELRGTLTPLANRIAEMCVDDPPTHLREGGLIRDGVDAELDEARGLQTDASKWLAEYQTRIVKEHELPGIKVGYNRVFGYYIELTRSQARHAPDSFIRKQTLKNAERYITPELKEFEDKITTAESRAIEREQHLFNDLCAHGVREAGAIREFAHLVAELDCLACFARVAQRRGWIKPDIADDPVLDIRDGAHPVLQRTLGDNFVPNDAILGSTEQPARLALITGPNMAGKSTYIRQVALIVLLAHTGSFVPASSATIGLTDRIFTRVGADDALHAGQSTFMVEMVETANILHHATARSLVILDEIGRGTSTLDGLSLAWAIAERLSSPSPTGRRWSAAGGSDEGQSDHPNRARKEAVVELSNSPSTHSSESCATNPPSPTGRGAGGEGLPQSISPRTLFATHYHELTTLEDESPERVRNLHVQVREWGDEIVFLHRIAPGRTDQSYGIHVAKLAGLPSGVVTRARELLERLAVTHEGAEAIKAAKKGSAPPQMSLFTEYVDHPVVDELRKLDLNSMSPMQAFELMCNLKDRAEDGQSS